MNGLPFHVQQNLNHVFYSGLRLSFQAEGAKGCQDVITPDPVELEPFYQPYELASFFREQDEVRYDTQKMQPLGEYAQLTFWLSDQEPFIWNEDENLLKELTSTNKRLAFEIVGNEAGIHVRLLCPAASVSSILIAVSTRLRSHHVQNDTVALESGRVMQTNSDQQWAFHDFVPNPPYFRCLTTYGEFKTSPLNSIYSTLAALADDELGVYQVIFQPVDKRHNWHRNVMNLLEAEEKAARLGSLNTEDWYAPGVALNLEEELRRKAAPDKPFFAVAVRIGAVAASIRLNTVLHTLSVPMHNFHYGGLPLRALGASHYQQYDCKSMLDSLCAYHPGMLLNSEELVGLVHLPPTEVVEQKPLPLDRTHRFDAPPVEDDGVMLGLAHRGEVAVPIIQPQRVRLRHASIAGKTGLGKSILMENMIMQDVMHGRGVAVLDPHGDLIHRILPQIPSERIDDVLYLDPTHPSRGPAFNPLSLPAGASPGKVADDFVVSFRNFLSSWGERMENIFRHAFYALLHHPGATLLDLRLLLSKSQDGEDFRCSIIPQLKQDEARRFWLDDFPRYNSAVFDPVLNKMSKFALNEHAARLFSQPVNRFSTSTMMDQAQIGLYYLPAGVLGDDAVNITGSLIISQFYHAALARRENRRPYYLYIDEFHRFSTRSLEAITRECRKYGLGLVLAYQQTKSLSPSVQVALENMGTKIVFAVDADDAKHASKDFGNEVAPAEFIQQDVGDAFVKIDRQVAKIRTEPPVDVSNDSVIEPTAVSDVPHSAAASVAPAEEADHNVLFDEF